MELLDFGRTRTRHRIRATRFATSRNDEQSARIARRSRSAVVGTWHIGISNPPASTNSLDSAMTWSQISRVKTRSSKVPPPCDTAAIASTGVPNILPNREQIRCVSSTDSPTGKGFVRTRHSEQGKRQSGRLSAAPLFPGQLITLWSRGRAQVFSVSSAHAQAYLSYLITRVVKVVRAGSGNSRPSQPSFSSFRC